LPESGGEKSKAPNLSSSFPQESQIGLMAIKSLKARKVLMLLERFREITREFPERILPNGNPAILQQLLQKVQIMVA